MENTRDLVSALAMWACGVVGLLGAGVVSAAPPYAIGVSAWASTAIFVLLFIHSPGPRRILSTLSVGWIGLALVVCASAPIWVATPAAGPPGRRSKSARNAKMQNGTAF